MKKLPLNNTIFTIGHSTRTLENFIELLHSFKNQILVDIRRYPGSRRYPYFNKEALGISLPQNNIRNQHLIEFGGRRKITVDSKNIVWRHAAFRGYADYMETTAFKEGIKVLAEIALQQPTVFMVPKLSGGAVMVNVLRLSKSKWLEGDAHHGYCQSRRTSLHYTCKNRKWKIDVQRR